MPRKERLAKQNTAKKEIAAEGAKKINLFIQTTGI